MKNMILILSVLFSLSCFGTVSVITDLDDTIKISQAGGNPTDLIGEDVYTGMPDFFMGSSFYTDKVYVLSASPSFMRNHIIKTLLKHLVAFDELILRQNIMEDKFIYKVRYIERILNENSDDFILIGDDLGKDPEVYQEIMRRFPERILASYIHVVNGRNLPEEVIPYWTSFDLSLREYLASRIDTKWVDESWVKLLSENDTEYIFPKKAQCPKTAVQWEWQLLTSFQMAAYQLANRLTLLCQYRD